MNQCRVCLNDIIMSKSEVVYVCVCADKWINQSIELHIWWIKNDIFYSAMYKQWLRDHVVGPRTRHNVYQCTTVVTLKVTNSRPTGQWVIHKNVSSSFSLRWSQLWYFSDSQTVSAAIRPFPIGWWMKRNRALPQLMGMHGTKPTQKYHIVSWIILNRSKTKYRKCISLTSQVNYILGGSSHLVSGL